MKSLSYAHEMSQIRSLRQCTACAFEVIRSNRGVKRSSRKPFCIQRCLKPQLTAKPYERVTHEWKTLTRFRTAAAAQQSLMTILSKDRRDIAHSKSTHPGTDFTPFRWIDRYNHRVYNEDTEQVIE